MAAQINNNELAVTSTAAEAIMSMAPVAVAFGQAAETAITDPSDEEDDGSSGPALSTPGSATPPPLEEPPRGSIFGGPAPVTPITGPRDAGAVNVTTEEQAEPTTAAADPNDDKGEGDAMFIYPADMIVTASGTIPDMKTLVSEFRNWYDYRQFCHLSEKVTLKFGRTTEGGKFSSELEMMAPKKLLCDFSDYFAAMFLRGPWIESSTGSVKFELEDVNPRVFMRVLDMLFLGGALPDMGGAVKGRAVEHITEHVRCWILADRFQMGLVMEWIKGAIHGWMVWLIHNWKLEIVRAAHDATATQQDVPDGFHAVQKRRLQDFSDAYCLIADMVPNNRPIQPDYLVSTLMQACPRELLIANLDSLNLYFTREITRGLLQ